MPRLRNKAYTKHTYSIYTVIKPALKVHDVCSKFTSSLLQVCFVCTSCMLPRVNEV